MFKNNAFTACFGLKFLLKSMFLNYCKKCVDVSAVDSSLLPLCRGQSATIQYYSRPNMLKKHNDVALALDLIYFLFQTKGQ